MKLLLAFYLTILCTFNLINSKRTVIDTPNKAQYQFFPVSGSCINIKVKATNDAHLSLAPIPKEANPMTEIHIGASGNTISAVRKNRTKPEALEVSTPGILNGNEFRGFWIKWKSGLVTVGREGQAATFLSHEDPYLQPINFVGVSTGWGATGSWIIDDCPVPSTTPKKNLGKCVTPLTGNKAGYWAIQGGFDGDQIYIGRPKTGGAAIPSMAQQIIIN